MKDDFLPREHKIYQVQHLISIYTYELIEKFGRPQEEINLDELEEKIETCIETIAQLI